MKCFSNIKRSKRSNLNKYQIHSVFKSKDRSAVLVNFKILFKITSALFELFFMMNKELITNSLQYSFFFFFLSKSLYEFSIKKYIYKSRCDRYEVSIRRSVTRLRRYLPPALLFFSPFFTFCSRYKTCLFTESESRKHACSLKVKVENMLVH